MLKIRPRGQLIAVVAVLLFSATQLIAQSTMFRVRGTVTDTSGNAIEGASVTLLLMPNGSKLDSAVTLTGTDGKYIVGIPVTGNPEGGTYAIRVKMLGFMPISHQRDFTQQISGNSFNVGIFFRMVPLPTTLGSVNVKRTRGSALASTRITAEEIDVKHARDALGVIARQRPGMFGDADICPGIPNATDEKQYAIQRVYVNGRRMDIPGRLPFNTGVYLIPKGTSMSPEVMAVLEDIDSADIDQIALVDCHNDLFPIDKRRAIYIALKSKPLTKKQKKALDELRIRDTVDTAQKTGQ